MSAERKNWLQARHAAMQTPVAVIEAQVLAATGGNVASARRLTVGEVNEVYDVLTTTGLPLIVRISHDEDPRFAAERWAMDQARAAGVPTPPVLHLAEVTLEDGRMARLCIEQKLPGTALDVLLDDGIWPERAIGELGRLLATLHEIRTDGFGYLQPDGRGWPITFASIMLDLIPQAAEVRAAAAHWHIDTRLVDVGLDTLQAARELYSYDDPRLVHGDFSIDHILIEGDRVTGIIDMQECAGGHPASDVAYWITISADRVPLDKLLASYPDGAEFAERNASLMSLMMLRRGLWMLMVSRDSEDWLSVPGHVENIERAMRLLGRAG
jgi:aminoglycoside phosphotransferase (APT) family kinase protein